MAVKMTIDLTDASFADLVALVDAARVAGVERQAPLELEGSALTIAVEPVSAASAGAAVSSTPAQAASTSPGSQPGSRGASDAAHRPLPQLGDAAIRSVVDILTGRQEPPRR